MFELHSLTTTDIIEMSSIAASLITSIAAIIISIKTLSQNNKMIEGTTRPYVAIYSRTTNFQSPAYYLVLKNFGQSSAVITSIKCDYNFSQCTYNAKPNPFERFNNTFISPGQSYVCSINVLTFFKNPVDLHFSVSYKTDCKEYNDAFTITPNADVDLVQTRAATEGKELRNISYTLQDLVEKQL